MMTLKSLANSKWPSLPLGSFAFASFSDLHLGHRRNNTERMIQALDKSLYSNGLLDFISVLFLAGDVFDRLLSLNDENIVFIDRWIAKLIKTCAVKRVALRVLEGTKSHDRAQSKRFETIYELLGMTSDFKYINKVDIEYLECVKAHALYVPDEAHSSTIETKAVVQAMLDAKGLQNVDVAVMHGFFEHQLPYGTKEGSFHDFNFYEGIVKHWITVGHVHTRSRVGKVLAQGSHDRLAHHEEEDKGFVVATCRTGKDEFWFIDNKLAHSYKTVNCFDLDAQQSLAAIDKVCETLETNSRVRIEAPPSHPIFESMLTLINRWPFIHLTKHIKHKPDKSSDQRTSPDALSTWVGVRIDKTNIAELINKRLTSRGIPSNQSQRILAQLQECV